MKVLLVACLFISTYNSNYSTVSLFHCPVKSVLWRVAQNVKPRFPVGPTTTFVRILANLELIHFRFCGNGYGW